MIEPVPTATGQPPSTADAAWPTWYRPVVWVGLALSLVASIFAFLTGNPEGVTPAAAVVYLAIPAAFVASIAASRRFGHEWAFVAAALLDIEAVLVAARASIGLAFAVILPVAGLVLVLSVGEARAHRLAFFVAWAASAVGIGIAFTVGPIAQLPGLTGVPLAVVGSAVFIALRQRPPRRCSPTCAPRPSRPRRRSSRRAAPAEAELDRTSAAPDGDRRRVARAHPGVLPDGTVVLWNPASERVFGWSSDEVVGSRLPAAMTPPEEGRADGAERIRRTIGGGVVNGERTRRLTRDGHEIWVDIYAAPMVDAEGADDRLRGPARRRDRADGPRGAAPPVRAGWRRSASCRAGSPTTSTTC